MTGEDSDASSSRTIAGVLPLAMLIIDENGIVIRANSRAATLTGYSVNELAGKSVAILDSVSTRNTGSILAQASDSGEPWGDETVCRRKAGELFSARRVMTKAPDGNLLLILDEIRSLYAQPDEFPRLITSNFTDVIWVWSVPEMKCLFVSPSVEPLTGYSPAEILNQTISSGTYPFTTAELDQAVSALEAGEESARVWTREFEFPCKNGTTVTTETIMKLLIDERGKVYRLLGVTRDIRRRASAHLAPAAAGEDYRQIFDGALEGIFRTSVEGRLISVNPAVAKMLGYDSPRELQTAITGIPWQLWVHRSDRERFVSLLEQHRTLRDYECQLRRKDGETLWASINIRRVYGPDGKALYNQGFIEDITARKRMQDALRQSEEKFSKAFLSSPACLCIIDVCDNRRILEVNEAFERVTGYRREEAIGRTVDELGFWAGLPDGDVGPTLGAGSIRNLEHRFRTKDGDIRTGLLSSELIDLDGRSCAITTNIDITERKEAEERIVILATAIEQAAEQVVITDLHGNIEYCNPAFEKTTGYTREEVLGQNPKLLKSGKQTDEFYQLMWKTITSGSVWTGQMTNRRKNGSLYEEESTISPVRDGSGKITRYVALKRDVSERIHLENQLRQAQKLESVGRLAGGVAHDFNNLLTVIHGYSGLLVDHLRPFDPLWQYADQIRKAGDRAAGLTRQLLAFSRKQVIEVKPFDLNLIVRDAERMLQRLIGEDVELITRLEAQQSTIMGDPDQIHQVIMNLVVNARDAMPDGGRVVIATQAVDIEENAARTHPDALPGKYVLLRISDTGSGMDEKTLESIFEPFFTTKEQGKGTGLGLSTVYGIVRQSGGWVEVSSRIGEGTMFTVYLPRTDATEALATHAKVPPQTAEETKTILIVEDQEEVRRLTKTVLMKHGYKVLEAGNGVEAFLLAKQHTDDIDLLLTDVVMPGMNGKELSDLVKNTRPKIKVLFSSGYTADVIAHRGVLDPDVAFLPKPFSAAELTNKIREILQD